MKGGLRAHHPAQEGGEDGVQAEHGDEQRPGGGDEQEERARVGVGPADQPVAALKRGRHVVQDVLHLERDFLHAVHPPLQPRHQCPLQLVVLQQRHARISTPHKLL